jgi:LPS export ABC transporter permease LptG
LLDRLLARELLRLFFATLAGVLLLYLLIDYADRSHTFNPGAGRAVLDLYANKAALVAYQVAPGAVIIAAALLVALLSRRGELDALAALGVSPLRLTIPVAAVALALGVAIFILGEAVVIGASARAESIEVKRFGRWGDYTRYHPGGSWVRGQNGRVFHLGPLRHGGFEPAVVLEIAAPFRLTRRIDAVRMEPAGPGRWRLHDAVEVTFVPSKNPGGEVHERRLDVVEEQYPESLEDLSLRTGRPQQLPWRQLREQTARRKVLGQPVREYQIALAERAAQPIQVVPAALASLGLSLRRRRDGRRRPLAAAIALGLSLSLALWAAATVARAAALQGTLPPTLAAFASALLAALVAAVCFARRPWR